MTDPSAGERAADLSEKLAVLRRIALDAGVGTLVLRRPATIGWLTGARWHVPQTLEAACFDVVVERAASRPELHIVTSTIEAPRLADTELADMPVQWSVVPWWQPRARAWPTGPSVGADLPLDGAQDVSAATESARLALTSIQRERLRTVCAEAADAATGTCRRAEPTWTEWETAASFAESMLARGLDVVCLFVAGDERIAQHRHPLPTGAALGRRAMVVACARRHGLVASVTRTVSFGAVPAAGRERYHALLEVEQTYLDATRPGARLGDAFAAGTAAYAAHGFDPHEWHRHHQGGLSGYAPREVLASPDHPLSVPEHAVAAWNPSGDGWKVEDTCLVADGGVEPLGHDPAWPVVEVGGRRRPDVLER
jgi:antitoxin VapB